MQVFEVEFAPALRSPIRIADAIRVATQPTPHIPLGDPETPGKGLRVPLTSRLAASLDRGAALMARAKAYRDPKTGQIVLGIEQAEDKQTDRALVLLSVRNDSLGGFSVSLPNHVGLLAQGQRDDMRQLLLIWPDGAGITVEDSMHDQRHEIRRSGDDFTRVVLE
ncbi:MAG TPA: hypothetical protein VLH58_08310 [Candidatus Methylomirabilis sp.]|nr:hypothetical protein [Candidatus Methylomirabilis sp.]HSC71341.1 hypothetical protein [Candidatus Methylomirabilis sp.]